MREAQATAGSAVFLVVVPGVVAGLIPWLLTGWEVGEGARHLWVLRAVGGVLVVAGIAILVLAFARFVREGRGTPAPLAPTEDLVVGGPYRDVRNPMYLAVGATIAGQALILARPILVIYASAFGIAVVAFVRLVEEPTLSRRYGPRYEAYRRAVPGWWPRRAPWDGDV